MLNSPDLTLIPSFLVGLINFYEKGILREIIIYQQLINFCYFVLVWAGNYNWVSFLQWSGQKPFKEFKGVPFLVDGIDIKEAGMLYTFGPLYFLKVNYQ